MDVILQILFPVFGIIVLGIALRSIGFLDQGMESNFNRFCYFIALPLFIFQKAANSDPLNKTSAISAGLLLIITLGLMAFAWICTKLIRLPKRSRGSFLQASFRGNLAYIGLPVIAFALSSESTEVQAHAMNLAILSMAPAVFVYNLLSVMVLEWDRRHEQNKNQFKACLTSTLKNPLILSCALGFAWNALAIPLPDTLLRLATPLATTAFPLALLAIGARIAGLNWRKELFPALVVSLVKNGFGLLIALGICTLFEIEGIPRLVLLVLSVCPTAVASYVLVDQLDGNRDLAASAIALTTFGSLFALTAALWIGL